MRIDLAGWSREATQGPHREFLALFEQAEALGYDGVWFHEFRLQEQAWPYPCPMLLAAAVLARTQRLRVGSSVLVAPLHRPQLLAEQVQQLQFQSGGRFDAGIGRGTDPATLQQLGIAPEQARESMERCVLALQQALSTEASDASALPLYLAASSEESIAFAVAQRIALLLSLEPPETVQLERLDAACAQQGRHPEAQALRQRSPISRYVVIGATAQDVQAQLQALWPKLWQRRLYFAAKRGQTPEQVPALDTAKALREQFIHGTPEQCVAQLRQLQQRTGCAHLRLVFNANGLLDWPAALAAMRLFAREAMPALRSKA
ncbi:LLM class flavin-dependent oxidoreductase [Vandammella animalimorsus]|uniref:LLM class flavin-dependent oxidoreductase n=1 Tax=Vandammella animalimorsus TaxID=2029117 RepID=A0A2A2AL89_9BURK|nr:LLM class flavin-dependent oxidoreductase [Vandammella animalimorsus]PAT38596.1 LLM class flavin-dependent oxidoreductase [Vandammella animalimorsus]